MCDSATDGFYDEKLHIISIFVIFIGSGLGILLPLLPEIVLKKKKKEEDKSNLLLKNLTFYCKWFGSGVILATSLVHLLFESFNTLSPNCINLTYEPLSPLIVLCSLLFVLTIDFSLARLMYRKRQAVMQTINNNQAITGEFDQEEKDLKRLQKIQAHTDVIIIESGIIFHSVIVGLTLGVATEPGFVALFIAIVFHQACDGLAIGSRMAELSYQGKRVQQIFMIISYALITPIGIGIGIGVKHNFDPAKVSTQLAIGILDSIASGVLLYGAIVDVLAKECFGTGGETNKVGLLEASNIEVASAFISLLFGAGIMSLLGHWA